MASHKAYDREYGWCSRRLVSCVCDAGHVTRVHRNAVARRGGVACSTCGRMTRVVKPEDVFAS